MTARTRTLINYTMFARILATLLSITLALCRASGNLYNGNEHIYELTASNFDKVVHRSNYTSIVKFYAPWCGYCKQLEPAFNRLGKYIHQDAQYAVNVVAVNCDSEANRMLCSKYHVQGFPTVMVFRPPKYVPGKTVLPTLKHVPETYNGERSLKSMTQFVLSRMKNYVKTLHGAKSLPKFLSSSPEMPHKAVLVTKTASLPPLLKTMAIDFLGSVQFGYLKVNSVQDVAEADLPITDNDELPQLFLWDSENSAFEKYSQGSLKDKTKVEKWISSITKANPGEGPLSKKEKKYYAKYRGARVHDEL